MFPMLARPWFHGWLLCWALLTTTNCFADADRVETLRAGSPEETACFIRESDMAGPTVLIVGGMHGNEPAGSVAAEQIRHWPIRRGKLLVLPRANVLALEAKSRNFPVASGVDASQQNLNRNFPRQVDQGLPRGELATEIWNLTQRFDPDWLLDLQEGFDCHRPNPDSVGTSVIASRIGAAEVIGARLVELLNPIIPGEDRDFVLLRDPVDGSLAGAAATHLESQALILETTFREQSLAYRVRQHRAMVHAVLSHLGMLEDSVSANTLTAPVPTATGVLHIALYDDQGVTGPGLSKLETLFDGRPGVECVRISGEDIRAGVLDQFDVVIFSGGSGSAQAKSLDELGRQQVRNFVDGGGDYVGICAGSYLACNGFSWGLKILDARTASSKWRRGSGMVDVELTPAGRTSLAFDTDRLSIKYVNGPILVPDNSPEIADFEVLAWFRSELSENEAPPGIMLNSPAVVRGQFGQGRVICFSPHPEQSIGCEALVWQALQP